MRDLGQRHRQGRSSISSATSCCNERRQSIENRPYGVEELELPDAALARGAPVPPPGHRLARRTSQAATRRRREGVLRDLVRPGERVARRRGRLRPAEDARRSSSKWFGTIPSRGKPVDPPAPPGFGDQKTTLTGVVRKTVPDDVELAKVTHRLAIAASLRARRRRDGSPRERALHGQGEPPLQGARLRPEDRAGGRGRARVAGPRLGLRGRRRSCGPASIRRRSRRRSSSRSRSSATQPVSTRGARSRAQRLRDGVRRSPAERPGARVAPQHVPGRRSATPGTSQRDLDRYRKATAQDLLAYAKKVLVPGRGRRPHHRAEEGGEAMKRAGGPRRSSQRLLDRCPAAARRRPRRCRRRRRRTASQARPSLPPPPPDPLGTSARAADAAAVPPAVARRLHGDERHHGVAARAPRGARSSRAR